MRCSPNLIEGLKGEESSAEMEIELFDIHAIIHP